MNIEVLFDFDCPNRAAALAQVEKALTLWQGVAAVQVSDPDKSETAASKRGFGSPTILVNGQDVAPEVGNDAGCCRVYSFEPGEPRGVPTVAMIVEALKAADHG